MLSRLSFISVSILSIQVSRALRVFEAPQVTEILPDVLFPLKAVSSALTLAPIGVVRWKTTTYPCPTKTTFTRPGDGETCTYDPGYPSSTASPPPTYPAPAPTPAPTTCESQGTVTVTVTANAPPTIPAPSPAGPTFSCPEQGYNIPQEGSNVIQAIDPVSGTSTDLTIQSTTTLRLNAIGYNVLDNTFYAVDSSTAPQRIVHIFADGALEAVGSLDANDTFNMGDCDTSGYYWLSFLGGSWKQYDVRPGSPTKGQLVASGTSTRPALGTPNDWAFVPNASTPGRGTFFSIITSSDGTAGFTRWDPATKVWTTFSQYPTLSVPVWGYAFAAVGNDTAPPRIVAADNGSGRIYTFPLDSSANFTTGPIGPMQGSGDAARCVLNAVA